MLLYVWNIWVCCWDINVGGVGLDAIDGLVGDVVDGIEREVVDSIGGKVVDGTLKEMWLMDEW